MQGLIQVAIGDIITADMVDLDKLGKRSRKCSVYFYDDIATLAIRPTRLTKPLQKCTVSTQDVSQQMWYGVHKPVKATALGDVSVIQCTVRTSGQLCVTFVGEFHDGDEVVFGAGAAAAVAHAPKKRGVSEVADAREDEDNIDMNIGPDPISPINSAHKHQMPPRKKAMTRIDARLEEVYRSRDDSQRAINETFHAIERDAIAETERRIAASPDARLPLTIAMINDIYHANVSALLANAQVERNSRIRATELRLGGDPADE